MIAPLLEDDVQVAVYLRPNEHDRVDDGVDAVLEGSRVSGRCDGAVRVIRIAAAELATEKQDAAKRDAASGTRLQEDPIQQRQHRWSADPAAETSAVHKLNVLLRKILKWLPHGEARSYTFYCECGCFEPGELTIAEYDAFEDKPSIWRVTSLEGHEPLEKR